jgi:hypothetical protein
MAGANPAAQLAARWATAQRLRSSAPFRGSGRRDAGAGTRAALGGTARRRGIRRPCRTDSSTGSPIGGDSPPARPADSRRIAWRVNSWSPHPTRAPRRREVSGDPGRGDAGAARRFVRPAIATLKVKPTEVRRPFPLRQESAGNEVRAGKLSIIFSASERDKCNDEWRRGRLSLFRLNSSSGVRPSRSVAVALRSVQNPIVRQTICRSPSLLTTTPLWSTLLSIHESRRGSDRHSVPVRETRLRHELQIYIHIEVRVGGIVWPVPRRGRLCTVRPFLFRWRGTGLRHIVPSAEGRSSLADA